MRFILLAVLVGLPIVDIMTLIQVGKWIGAWPTAGLVALFATVGIALVRSHGLKLLGQARTTLAAGSFPAREVFDGACILIGGALLLLPGFASDALSLVLLLPAARSLLRRFVARRISRFGRATVGMVDSRRSDEQTAAGEVIEGEYETVEPCGRLEQRQVSDSAPHSQSPWSLT